MKKVLSVLVALLLITVACVPAFAADFAADLESSAATAAVGDVITVSFKVPAGLSGLKATLEYDTTCYEYVAGSAEATSLFTTIINDTEAGKITAASASTDAQDAGVVFTAKFKVLKADGVFTASVADAIDATDAAVTVAGDELAITVTAAPATTAPAESTTSAPESNNNNNSSSKNPKTGGKLYVTSASAVAVLAAAVVVTMKKKNED